MNPPDPSPESPTAETASAKLFIAGDPDGKRGVPGDLPIPLGGVIGPYKLLSVLGDGGFGVVYLAEQTGPIRRKVALKVIRPGMGSREIIARFEQERQALALMDHPNVARVFDAGTIGDIPPTTNTAPQDSGPSAQASATLGLPYFVMEYVQGEPITSFCDRHRFTIRQRLDLFTQACEAVQHAHTKGIIHRDLKPSNILVAMSADKPRVKVIDFGVAKALASPLTEKTIFTQTGCLIGTPEYMSPEQADIGAVDVDTRSDVYSLGVVLYELLCGATPFDSRSLRSAGFHEMQRIIREVDPPTPEQRLIIDSARREEIAERRGTLTDPLRRQISSELEWIPLKALRKARSDRYRSASELMDDVRSYLADRPLLAGPESAAYRMQKFLLRHRHRVIAAGAVVLALLLGFVALSFQTVATAREARRAVLAESISRARAEALARTNDALEKRSAAVRDSLVRLLANLHASVYRLAALRVPIGLFRRDDGTVMRLWYRIMAGVHGDQLRVTVEKCPVASDERDPQMIEYGSDGPAYTKWPSPEPIFESADDAVLGRLKLELETNDRHDQPRPRPRSSRTARTSPD